MPLDCQLEPGLWSKTPAQLWKEWLIATPRSGSCSFRIRAIPNLQPLLWVSWGRSASCTRLQPRWQTQCCRLYPCSSTLSVSWNFRDGPPHCPTTVWVISTIMKRANGDHQLFAEKEDGLFIQGVGYLLWASTTKFQKKNSEFSLSEPRKISKSHIFLYAALHDRI